jgi:hypothetical protein
MIKCNLRTKTASYIPGYMEPVPVEKQKIESKRIVFIDVNYVVIKFR